MPVKEFAYKYNGRVYPVIITRKRMKNITYRFRNGQFLISAPWFATKSTFIAGLDRFAAKLVNHENKKVEGRGKNFIYLLGDKYDIGPMGVLTFGNTTIVYSGTEDLDKKLKKWFLKFITQRVRFYQEQMGLEEYKVRVQQMKTRYGSNSKHTKTLNFNLGLMHYSQEIIDSVVVHELAHEVVFNHSKEFYDVVYRYYPQYDVCHNKLKKGEFK